MKEQTWQQWVRAVVKETETRPNHQSRLRKGCLGALTGTDAKALNAFVACLQLYAYTGNKEPLDAARAVLAEMQDSTRWIARELIPFVLDWGDRERIWGLVVPRTLEAVS